MARINVVTYLHSIREAGMNITTVTSRELNQDVAGARRATKSGPVFITTRGKPSHVLLSIEDYRRLAGERRNLADALSMAGLGEIDLDPPRSRIGIRLIKEELL